MGKLEQAFKSEITRLAKKQLRATYLPLARDVRRLKRSLSALRKTVAVLARLRAELQVQRTAERARLAAAPEEVKAARISPLLIKKLRKRLGITQGELARLVGVSGSALHGEGDPVAECHPRLFEVRRKMVAPLRQDVDENCASGPEDSETLVDPPD